MRRSRMTTWMMLGGLACGVAPAAAAEGPVAEVVTGVEVGAEVVAGAEVVVEAPATPYLGLVVVPTSPEARARLMLPVSVGLTVLEVADRSPAAAAGLQRHDVVTRFDDQILVNAAQLGALVQMRGAGATVTLTVYRDGLALEVPAVIGATDDRRVGRLARPVVRFGPAGLEVLPGADDEAGQMVAAGADPAAGRRAVEAQLRDLRAEVRADPQIEDEARGRRLEAMIDQAMGGGEAAQRDAAQPVIRAMRMTDAQHVIEIRSGRDGRRLKVSDRQGQVLFEGPIDTAEQRAQVPADLLAKTLRLEARAEARLGAAAVRPADR